MESWSVPFHDQLLIALGDNIQMLGVDPTKVDLLFFLYKEFSNWPTIPQLYVAGEFVRMR